MSARTFFHPTVAVSVSSFLITVLAGAALYYALLCGLDASGSCMQVPFAGQLLIIGLLWPWVAAVRFIGSEAIAFASVIGFVLSTMWIFLWICCARWIVAFIKTKRIKK